MIRSLLRRQHLIQPSKPVGSMEQLFTWGVESIFSRISTDVHEPMKEIRERTIKELLRKDIERRFCRPLRRSASAGTIPERET